MPLQLEKTKGTKDEQFAKAEVPTLRTDEGIETDLSSLQFANALAEIEVNPKGTTTFCWQTGTNVVGEAVGIDVGASVGTAVKEQPPEFAALN